MRDAFTQQTVGLHFSVWRPGPFHLSAGEPECEDHGSGMELLYASDLPDGFDLKDSTELWTCPTCHPSDDEIDTVALADAIVSSWDEYSDHFKNAHPPDVEPHRGGFVFG